MTSLITRTIIMLSGMNPKDRTDLDKAVNAYLNAGGKITTVKGRRVKRHNARSKSYAFWGKAK